MRTKRELSTAVLTGDLRIIGAGQSIPSEDAALVEDAYDAKLAEWRRRGFVWWTNTSASTEEIPDEVFAILVDLMDNEVGAAYGKGKGGAEKRLEETELLRSLRILNSKPPSGEQTPFSAY